MLHVDDKSSIAFQYNQRLAEIVIKYRVFQQVWCLHKKVPTIPPEQNLFYEKFPFVY